MQGWRVELDAVQRRRFGGSSADKTAFQRALGALEKDGALRNPDWLARRFVADLPEVRAMLCLAGSIPFLHASLRWGLEQVVAGGYWHEVARVKHFDSILLEQASQGVPQVVVLGAGLDSRSYRFASELAEARVFEVDHPVVAARKRARVADVLGTPPENVTYVSVDLSEDGLDRVMAEAGFDPEAPVFVLWIGVSMYLPESSVSDVFRWVSRRPAGSSIAFDYLHRDVAEGEVDALGVKLMRHLLERGGEPFLFGLDPGAVDGELERHGLAVKDHCGPAEISSRWLRHGDGTPAGRLGDLTGYVHAEVAAA